MRVTLTLLAMLLMAAAARQIQIAAKLPVRLRNHRRTTSSLRPAALTARGGGDECSDSDSRIAIKAAITAGIETVCLLGVLHLGQVCAPTVTQWLTKLKLPSKVFGLPLTEWVSSVFVIFSSSAVKSWLKGGMSAANVQALKPSVVPGDANWYANLKKPWFNPPGWLFPIMWLIVSKPTQLVAISKMLSKSPTPYWPTLTVYCAHLSLGDAWNDVFFGCQRVGLGAYVISSFFSMLLLSTTLIWNVDPVAGKYMLPTCGWVSVATALNLRIYALNK